MEGDPDVLPGDFQVEESAAGFVGKGGDGEDDISYYEREEIAMIIMQECFPEKNVLAVEMFRNAARAAKAARRIIKECIE